MLSPATRHVVRRSLVLTGFVGVYVLALYLGRATRTEDSQVALAWPSAGVGVWFLASMRGRVEVLCAGGAMALAVLLVNVATGLAVATSTVFALINCAHAVVGLVLLRVLLPAPAGLREPGHISRLLLVAAGAAAVSGSASATVAVLLLGESFWPSLLLFVVRNGGTTFVILAAVLSLSRPHGIRDLVSSDRVVELGLIGAGSAATFLVVFTAPGQLPVLFIALGSSVLVGTRLGVARAGLLGLVLSGLAVTATLMGRGPLAGVDDVQTRAVLVQAFTVLVLVVSLSLATLQRAKDELATHLAASLAQLQEANDSALIGKAVAVRGEDGGWSLTTPNPALIALLGRDPSGLRWGQLIHLDDRPTVRTALEEIAAGRRARWEGEVRHRRPGDIYVWTQLHISRMTRADGASAVVVQVLDIADRRVQLDELRHRADHDPLTALPNRSTLQQHLEALLATTTTPDTLAATATRPYTATSPGAEPGTGVAVLFLDLDRFKAVNDTYGHDAGDRVLMQVAEALQHSLRPGDLVSRFGGDEFVICCPGVSEPSQTARVVGRLHAAVAPALLLHGRDVGLDLSIGVAIATAGENATDLLRRADVAMYAEKRRAYRPGRVPATTV